MCDSDGAMIVKEQYPPPQHGIGSSRPSDDQWLDDHDQDSKGSKDGCTGVSSGTRNVWITTILLLRLRMPALDSIVSVATRPPRKNTRLVMRGT